MIRAATALILVLAAIAGPAPAREITGQLAYRERVALPPDARLSVELRGAEGIVAELREPAAGREVPLPFRLEGTAATLVLQAAILSGSEVLWLSEPVEIAPGDGAVALGLVPLAAHKAIPFATTLACGTTLVQAGIRDTTARLRLGAETRDLAQVEAASGARYSDGGLPETSFWSRGARATAVWSGVELPECAPFPDPARQTVAARGNEPGWVMTAGPDGMAFSSESGAALAGALPPARLTAEAMTWAIPGGPALTLAPGLCNDTMTGMPFPMTAAVTVDGQSLTGCAGDPADLLAGDWRVTELADAPLPEGTEGSLRFEAGQVSGRAFCNRFSGGFTLGGEGLRFGPAAATRMACPPAQMAAEGAFLAALAKVDRFDIAADGTLELIGGDRVLLRAAR